MCGGCRDRLPPLLLSACGYDVDEFGDKSITGVKLDARNNGLGQISALPQPCADHLNVTGAKRMQKNCCKTDAQSRFVMEIGTTTDSLERKIRNDEINLKSLQYIFVKN